ncbi:DUF2026 family protein [Rhizobium rhizogenes]|uniref:DUF2026 family protein n=1 Tax=Rhizobium rhizogenes TaxID=359 RepID=UPI00157239D3|nr:DUF2026 family protein [Rhizobium rhizogenes]NTF45727.1 DUF2026 family protein [Rhizobium rhizogenes]
MLITQSDYHRIYRVINSLLINENANPATASMYFSTFGAFILEHHFKVKAKPKGGLAAYNLGGKHILFADQREDGHVSGAGENFHCWIEADDWAIDFMAPAFSQSAPGLLIPSKMFQRPLSAMAASINDLAQSGDFFYHSEPDATSRRFADWRKHPMIGDLAIVATNWFRKSPKKMQASITVQDRGGKTNLVPLIGNPLAGAW